jgi:ABC-type glycerol-3-phosphate transport system substrate-binding protein
MIEPTSMTEPASSLSSGLSRRSLLRGMAGGAAGLALAPLLGSLPVQAAPTPGSNPGKYKLDLGGYTGPELTADTITLKVMRQDFPPAVNDSISAAYTAFSKAYPNITVQEERVPYGDLPQKVQVYVASGTAPDVMMGRNDFASAYAAGQLTAPLQKYLSQDFLDDMYAPLRDSATIDGNLTCLPWETNPVYMMFNKDIFKKLGVATPPEVTDIHAGWTVEQYLACFKELTTKLRASGDTATFALASSTYGNGGPGSNYTQLESIWVRMMGDPAADKSSSTYKTFAGVSDDGLTATGYIDTPEAAAGMTNYQSLFKNGYTPTGFVPDQFTAGTAAVTFGGTGAGARLKAAGQNFAWGASPAPTGKIAYTTTVADSPFVWSGSPHLNEAVALLAFLNNDTNRNAFHDTWGSMPVRKSLIAMRAAHVTDPTLPLAIAVANSAYGPPKSVGWFDYFSAINPAVKDIALGADPQQRLHDVAGQIDGLLAKYK